ncbi:CDP-diacylglycerol--inositol 3-phosphatidyltransferase [Zerene cesonia]|uniref:CDP-diacylglycerol--inositol 3-phosphatidyltransferase n=1 Tax=Zerene cesonia TaxID=33412 RepID=UPI0018E5704B|nr:CDP-diacylglycerol--inositol 3-phosphatidyltransferase [Zerene cesonia]XP_038217498.1 CDP-diacylglycerol--inositol 3-phosphatidyltransferase [Zerene cesonia]
MSETRENIFLFVPNIIGYARIILAIVSFYYMPTHCGFACICYITSALLDAIDGHAARYFNQSTKFGAMLDQLTDRAGTAGLLMTLATFYPKYTFWFQISMIIDITCHWIFLHASILQGKTSHKFIDMSENPIMHVYYTNKTVLFCMCAGNEAFYAALYVSYFYTGLTIFGIGIFPMIAVLSAPVALVKTLISVLHAIVASINLATIDNQERAAIAAKQSN